LNVAKFGLGKGLGALIPEHQQYFDSSRNLSDIDPIVRIVPLSALQPNPNQPRKTFPEGSIDELADSIRKHGLLQPIIVESGREGKYIIIAGERRFRAASRAGLADVPVILRSVSSEKRLQISLIENIQREDLNPMEEAEAYRSLMDLSGFTQEQIAEAVGKNRSTVANALRLTKLSSSMQDAVRSGGISAGHARSLLAVSDPMFRETLFKRIMSEGLSVRQAEEAVQESSDGSRIGKSRGRSPVKGNSELDRRDPNILALRDLLIERLGTKVDIKGDMEKGTVSIEYFTSDDLQRILDVMGAGG
jgi:ParB family chromosome partitioning protein